MNSIPLASLPTLTDARRDRWGRYLVAPSAGAKPVGYTRVTTVAKALDDGGGLAPWKATMATVGTLIRPGLRAQWEALLAEYGLDPWYAGTEAKAKCRRLVEECAAVGGANDRRDIGTSLHTITALADLGRVPTQLTEETQRDLDAYAAGLAANGIVILPDMIERTVVLDDYSVAGTFDRAVTVPGFELPLIADLKTGADLSYSWRSIAVQLAAYSRGDCLYRQGAAPDGSQDVREPMPAVDQSNGLVMWLNAGSGRLELHLVDLDAGWRAFAQSMDARTWRQASVNKPLASGGWGRSPGGAIGPGDLTPLLEASIAAHPSNHEPAPPPEPDDLTLAMRQWLGERIAAIGKHDLARKDLGQSWPVTDLPTLRSSDDHTPEQLAVIERLVSDVERRHELPFPRPRPGHDDDPVGKVLAMFPNSTVITKDTAS